MNVVQPSSAATSESQEALGFIGLGLMGEPMALNLLRAGRSLVVWNRSTAKAARLVAAGATLASSPSEVFRRTRTIILMLANEEAIDSVLDRRGPEFRSRVGGRVIIQMGTTSPEYSLILESEVRAGGGSYAEAPVSGSRVPAEQGQLVAMVAAEFPETEELETLLQPMCKQVIFCGSVPSALRMKLSVNLFLITMVTGLVEAFHLARRQSLNLATLCSVLDSSPMASSVSRVKLSKLVADDFSPQASIADVLKNAELVADAAKTAQAPAPLLNVCRLLYSDALRVGCGELDMVAVLRALETTGKTTWK